MTNQQKQCATVQHTNAIRLFNQIINSVIDFNKSVKVPINDIARKVSKPIISFLMPDPLKNGYWHWHYPACCRLNHHDAYSLFCYSILAALCDLYHMEYQVEIPLSFYTNDEPGEYSRVNLTNTDIYDSYCSM
jgi:hypothetical protein